MSGLTALYRGFTLTEMCMLMWLYFIWFLFPADSTLTLSMLTQLTQVVSMLSFTGWLEIPDSVRDTISKQYSSKVDLNTAVWEWYLHNHPAPSWRHVAHVLYSQGKHTVLEGVKDQVPSLKGESSVHVHPPSPPPEC